MLQSIREKTQGWIAGTIVTIIIITFALWGIHSYFIGGGVSNVVASVNGVDITREQLTVAYDRLRRQNQMQYGANSPLNTRDESSLKERALKALIDIEVLKQASLSQGFQISDRQVDSYLQNMPEFQVDGQFSVQRFQEILSSTMLNTGEFLDLIRASMLIDQPKLGIIFTSFALPDETDYTIGLVNQERDIDYVTIPVQTFLSQLAPISADKIKAYYSKHQTEFMTPERTSIEYLEISIKDLAKQINPTDIALKNFYNENINSYSQPMSWKLVGFEIPVASTTTIDDIKIAQTKASEVVTALQKNTDSKILAKSYKQILTGEDWLALNQIPVELQTAVSGLVKSGDVSTPIKTDKGLVVLQAIAIQEPKIEPYDVVKDKVKDTYIHQRAEEKFAELRDRLADLTYESPDSLQPAAKALALPIKSSELFTKDKATTDIAQYKKVRDTAFTNDVMNLQNNSDVIQLTPETIIVLRMKSHVPSALLPLSGVSKQIAEKLRAQEAEIAAANFAENLKKKLEAGTDPQTLVSSNKLTWSKAGLIGRYSTKVDSAILDTAFRMPNPSAQMKPVYGTTRLPNGYALIAVKAVKPGVVADEKQRTVFAEQVQNSEGLLEYELYKQSQAANADIEIEK